MKDNIIHKLINQNCEENTNRTKINQRSTKITPNNTQGNNDINDSDKNNSINAKKEEVTTIKENSTSVKSNSQRSERSKNQISKAKPKKHIEVIGDSMPNCIHERGMNKDENMKVKVQKYPGASSILNHVRPSLWKAPEEIIIHAGTNDISNNTNYVKKLIPGLASPQ